MGLGEKGAQGVCTRSNLTLFVLVLVNQNLGQARDEHEDDDEDDWNQPVTRIRPIRSFQSKIRNPKSAIEGP